MCIHRSQIRVVLVRWNGAGDYQMYPGEGINTTFPIRKEFPIPARVYSSSEIEDMKTRLYTIDPNVEITIVTVDTFLNQFTNGSPCPPYEEPLPGGE